MLGNIHTADQINRGQSCHAMTATDSFGFAGQKAWHGLGAQVADGTTMGEGIRRFLPWRMVLTDGVAGTIDGQRRIVTDDYRLLVRDDTGDVFAAVTDTYKPVQNEELGDMLAALTDAAAGDLKLETIGSLKGGRRVFILLDGGSFGLNNERDQVRRYMLAHAGHDGTAAVTTGPTTIRVVCKNTANAALAGMGGAFTFRHSGNIDAKLREARSALDRYRKGQAAYEAAARKLDARPMKREELQEFWTRVYIELERDGKALPTTPTNSAEREELNDAAQVLARWSRNWDQEISADVASASAWTAANAVTRWYDHQRTVRGSDDAARRENRIHTALFGQSADRKAHAFKAALALV